MSSRCYILRFPCHGIVPTDADRAKFSLLEYLLYWDLPRFEGFFEGLFDPADIAFWSRQAFFVRSFPQQHFILGLQVVGGGLLFATVYQMLFLTGSSGVSRKVFEERFHNARDTFPSCRGVACRKERKGLRPVDLVHQILNVLDWFDREMGKCASQVLGGTATFEVLGETRTMSLRGKRIIEEATNEVVVPESKISSKRLVSLLDSGVSIKRRFPRDISLMSTETLNIPGLGPEDGVVYQEPLIPLNHLLNRVTNNGKGGEIVERVEGVASRSASVGLSSETGKDLPGVLGTVYDCNLQFLATDRIFALWVEGREADKYFSEVDLPEVQGWAWDIGIGGEVWRVPELSPEARQTLSRFIAELPLKTREELQALVDEFEEKARRPPSRDLALQANFSPDYFFNVGLAQYRLGMMTGERGLLEAAMDTFDELVNANFKDRDFRNRIVRGLYHDSKTRLGLLEEGRAWKRKRERIPSESGQ